MWVEHVPVPMSGWNHSRSLVMAALEAFSCFFPLTNLSYNVLLMGNSQNNLTARCVLFSIRNALEDCRFVRRKTRKGFQCDQVLMVYIIRVHGQK